MALGVAASAATRGDRSEGRLVERDRRDRLGFDALRFVRRATNTWAIRLVTFTRRSGRAHASLSATSCGSPGPAELDRVVSDACGPWRHQIDLLQTIAGGGEMVAEVIVAETGSDMSRFPTAAHLAAWVGLVPAMHGRWETRRTAAGKRRGNKWLAAMLVEAAGSVGRMRETNYLAAARPAGPARWHGLGPRLRQALDPGRGLPHAAARAAVRRSRPGLAPAGVTSKSTRVDSSVPNSCSDSVEPGSAAVTPEREAGGWAIWTS